MSNNNLNNNDFKKKVNSFVFGSIDNIAKFLAARIVASILVGIATFFFCNIIGIKPAWLLAIIAGLGNLIPMIGPWIVMIICAIIAVFQTPIWALHITIFCIAIQAVDQFLITPLILGKSINLSPLVIIIVVTFASIFMGFWGLLFAVPIAIIVNLFYTIFIRNKEKETVTQSNVTIDKGNVE